MTTLNQILSKYTPFFSPVVGFDFRKDAYATLDFSVRNQDLKHRNLSNLPEMKQYIQEALAKQNASIGIGGYAEERDVYQKSEVFDTQAGASRSIHLGVDIWLEAGAPVYAPLEARVHSFQNNSAFGDYGATIILEHTLEGVLFYTLYGHLSLQSLENLLVGQVILQGANFAFIGDETVNGGWVPHLHFQIIADMLDKVGDFWGVAPKSELEYYLALCPNPTLILGNE